MMPVSAASIGPRSEVSSQGYTTTVVAGEASLARAMSRSYLVCGGAANGPSAEIVPMSSLSAAMIASPPLPSTRNAGAALGSLGRALLSGLAKGGRNAAVADTEQAADLRQPRAVLGRQRSGRAEHLADQVEGLGAGFRIGGKHRRNRRERGILMDVQHVELLAHQRLERRKAQVGMSLANPAQRLEPALVDRTSRHAGIEQAADHRRAHPARRYRRFELGVPLLQELAMQRALRRPAQRLCACGVDADGSLEGRVAVD